MAFVGGPRQVGKTTLALALLGPKATERHPAYFNWDDPRAAARLRRVELPPHEPLLVCDEVHKYARWRNLLKGIYDTEKSFRRIVVTGSARLDYYRKGGDSLANRYRYFRLHPFSLRELDPTALGVAPRGAASVRRLSGAALPPGRDRASHLAAGSPGAGGPRGPAGPGARPRGEPRRAARRPAAGARRRAAVGRQPAPGPRGRSQDRRAVADDPREHVRLLSPAAVRVTPDPGGEEGEEALPLGLVGRCRSRRTVREPGGVPAAQVLPLGRGHRGLPHGAALPQGHRPARGGLRRAARRAAAVRGRVQDRRASHQPGGALLRRADADPALLPGPPRRPSLRVWQGDGAAVHRVLPGARACRETPP